MEVDKAVFFAIAARVWKFVAGPITLVLIGTYFSPDLQGYFYTFASLLALQSFIELGFHVAIINVASHEWSKLELDAAGRIVGDAAAISRLVSLGRFIGQWYAAACAIFVAAVGLGGVVFFSFNPSPNVTWFEPWIALVLINGAILWTLPFVAMLEGCNQMATVNRYRLVQAITGNLVVWASLVLGLELWTAVASAVTQVIWEIVLLAIHYRHFFRPFFFKPAGPSIAWRTEVWPLQWRLAVQGTFNYLALWMYTPVMFQSHSPEVAGQMGMTWSVLTSLQMVALAWVQARVPLFGTLIARRDFRELDRVFRRLTSIALAVFGAGACLLVMLVVGLNMIHHSLATRLLTPLEIVVFAMALLLQTLSYSLGVYIRAHKQDPYYWGSVINSIVIGLLVVYLGTRFGPIGAGIAFLVPVCVIEIPYRLSVWAYCRKAWH